MTRVLARYVDKGKWGYVRVRLDDGRIIPEHRFVVEQRLGRSLLSSEHVHHKNEDRRDNRPSNLELLPNSEHAKEHAAERVQAARVGLLCPVCGDKFHRTKSYIRAKTSAGVDRFCCSNRCGRSTSNKGK